MPLQASYYNKVFVCILKVFFNLFTQSFVFSDKVKELTHKLITLVLKTGKRRKNIEKSKIGNYFISTKEDKNKHGIGQISIERTVDKYGGIIDVKLEDNKFEIMMILYC